MNNIETQRKLNEEEFKQEIKKFPLHDFDGFYWKYDLQGYAFFVFGTRAGFGNNIWNLTHELAHAAEFGWKSFEYRGEDGFFNFIIPKKNCIGCIDFEKDLHILREIRTFAIQIHLIELMGYECNKKDLIEDFYDTCDFLPGRWTYNENIDEFSTRVEKYYSEYNKEQILDELKMWFLCVRRKKLKCAEQFELEATN